MRRGIPTWKEIPPLWTELLVKELLPDITVDFGDKRSPVAARVTGRLNRFATVSPLDRDGHTYGLHYQASWSAVTRCVVSSAPLLV